MESQALRDYLRSNCKMREARLPHPNRLKEDIARLGVLPQLDEAGLTGLSERAFESPNVEIMAGQHQFSIPSPFELEPKIANGLNLDPNTNAWRGPFHWVPIPVLREVGSTPLEAPECPIETRTLQVYRGVSRSAPALESGYFEQLLEAHETVQALNIYERLTQKAHEFLNYLKRVPEAQLTSLQNITKLELNKLIKEFLLIKTYVRLLLNQFQALLLDWLFLRNLAPTLENGGYHRDPTQQSVLERCVQSIEATLRNIIKAMRIKTQILDPRAEAPELEAHLEGMNRIEANRARARLLK